MCKIKLFICVCVVCTLTSCYTYTSVVGKGSQGKGKVVAWNHYVVYGLAPISISDSKKMANGAKDYTVTTEHSFVTQLVGGLTFGLYTPTITTVKR